MLTRALEVSQMLRKREVYSGAKRELSGLHAARSMLYLAMWRLLRAPAESGMLELVRTHIGLGVGQIPGAGSFVDLEHAVVKLTPATLEAARRFLHNSALTCSAPMEDAWKQAFETVGLDPAPDPIEELRVLGLLAKHLERRLVQGDLVAAARVGELELELLKGHAGACLRSLSEQLAGSGEPVLEAVATALAWLIDHDLNYLDAGVSHRRAPVTSEPQSSHLNVMEKAMRVADWMKKPVETIKPRESVARARAILEHKRINQLPVVVENRLVGIVTDRDLRDAFPSVFEVPRRKRLVKAGVDPEQVPVEDVMSPNVLTVGPADELAHAARLMRNERVGALPVVDGGKLVGILTRSDLLDALVAAVESTTDRPRRPEQPWL